MSGPVPGADGVLRCPWATSAPEYVGYHDAEWGVAVRDDAGLYERVVLEGFQAGLAWITVLRKREALRRAFAGFDPAVVAGFGDADMARVMADPGVVRNGAKVRAAVTNARATLDLGPGGLTALVWRHAPVTPAPAPSSAADVPAVTADSVALSRELKRAGFTFVGPTTCYALMQACGLVDDHLAGCHRRGAA